VTLLKSLCFPVLSTGTCSTPLQNDHSSTSTVLEATVSAHRFFLPPTLLPALAVNN